MNDKKTQRKNKTNQTIVWPTNEDYFTIKDLIKTNEHMLTSSKSDITLRVRLSKAITEENLVAAIGTRNSGKGRPELILSMRPVKQSVLDKAKSEKIFLAEDSKLIPVMEFSTTLNTSVSVVTSNIESAKVVLAE